MAKLSSSVGRAISGAYVLYACRKGGVSGYRLLHDAKEIMMFNWSPGSFYPIINSLVKDGMLTKSKAEGGRLTYEYKTTRKGMDYLSHVSNVFKKSEVKEFFTSLIEGRF